MKAIGVWKPALLLSVMMVGCRPIPSPPREVSRSFYLDKKLVRFVADNGVPYREVRLEDGGTLFYWRSDLGGLMIGVSGSGNDSLDFCEIALRTDARRIIRMIYLIEESTLCNAVLK